MKKAEWNLSDIYATEEDLKKDWKFVETNIERLKGFEGKLNSAKDILEYFILRDKIGRCLDKIYVMRYMKKDENVLDPKANREFAEAEALYQEYNNATSFFGIELLQKSKEFLENIFVEEPKLETYRVELEDIIKSKEHYLSKEEELILTSLTRTFDSFSTIYETITAGDLKFEPVYDSNGKEYSNETLLNTSCDRTLRKSKHESVYNAYKSVAHTIAKIYLANVQSGITCSKIRKYHSYFEMEMENTDSTCEVYDSLISTVNAKLSINHRYFALRKKLLGLEKMYIFDIGTPIVTGTDEITYTYEQAKKMTLEAVKPLGKEYTDILKNAFESKWAHVYPQENKATGAYCYRMYDTHPYVRLHFIGNFDSVSSVAHEFGHAMHYYYSNSFQPYTTYDPQIMVAEVASTTNEILLAEKVIEDEKDISKKINYIQKLIKNFNSKVVRQTMFAEFEKWVYNETENGKELTCEDLCNYYGLLVKKYYGDAIEETEGIEYEWESIPHFYEPFYVYKYATGLSAAICIVENLSNKGKEYADRYIEMLKMGGSVKPLDQLKSIGVNLETDEPINKAFDYYGRKIDELENLIQQLKI